MKKICLNSLFLILSILLINGCTKNENDTEIATDYSGSYCGTLMENDLYVGLWTGNIDKEGIITLSILVHGPETVTGIVAPNGTFTLIEKDSPVTGKGTVLKNGSINGSLENVAFSTCHIQGERNKNELDYIGTWYQSSGEIYYELVLTEESYSINQDGDNNGTYESIGIDAGTFIVHGNDLIIKTNTSSISSKYYVAGETLIVAIDGFSIDIYGKTDLNPNQ